MTTIHLTKGYTTEVDDEIYTLISHHKWCALVCHGGHVYALRRDSTGQPILMHRSIVGALPDDEVDHINGDTLNNHRANLRTCTKAQNQHNSALRIDNKSGYKGVSWYSRYQIWRASIRVNGKWNHIGYYADPIQAALAYDTRANDLFGEFARLNFREMFV